MNQQYGDLIQNSKLIHVAYKTQWPVETVHPRITYRDDTPYVYCNKESVRLKDFMVRYASGEAGLRLGAYRANGRQTSISFTREEQVTLGAPFVDAINELRRLAHLRTPNIVPERRPLLKR